jgi:hypothetical protein
MTDRLGAALRAVAERVPPADVPPDLFDRARAKHRRWLATRAAAGAVVLLLSVGYVSQVTGAAQGPAGAGTGGPGLPSELRVPPLRTATIGQSAPGAAAAIFGGDATTDNWNEGRYAVVAGDDDRYRVVADLPYRPPGFESLLSPDGRYLAHDHKITDLTGRDDPDVQPAGEPLAFSPDGSLIVSSSALHSDSGGDPYAVIYRVDGRGEPLRLSIGGEWLIPGWSAAVSPDNSTVALQVRDEVWLTRLDGARGSEQPLEPYLKISLRAGDRLAGPGSWLPAGDLLAVAERDGDGWRLAMRDAATGKAASRTGLPDLPDSRYVRLAGWRSADTALALVGVPVPGATPTPDDHDEAWGPYRDHQSAGVRLVALHRDATGPEELLSTPAGVTELDVAADLAIAGVVRRSGAPSYGPPHPYLLAGLACLLVPPLLILLLARPRWRHRRRTDR